MSRTAFVLFVLFIGHSLGASLGSLGDLVNDASDLYDKGEKIKDIYEKPKLFKDSYDHCRSTGATAGACLAFATWCTAYEYFKPSKFGFSLYDYILPPVNKFCLGEPVLKCCRTTGGCHSAFNDPAPINCEGNPAYGPTYTAGLCLAPCESGCPGCLCNYLATCYGEFDPSQGCTTDDCRKKRQDPWITNSTVLQNDTWFAFGRRGSFFQRLTSEIDSVLVANSNFQGIFSEGADFMTMRGCAGWLEVFEDIMPFVEFNATNYAGRNVRADIFLETWQYQRNQKYLAGSRVISAIPNFWGRFDYINSFVWTPSDQDAYLAKLGGQTADKELGKYLSPVGMEILKKAMYNNWQLMAVPLANEVLNTNNMRDGCELGRAPNISISFSDLNTGGILTLTLGDQAVNSSSYWIADPIRIDWGDGVIQTDAFSLSETSRQYSHIFPSPSKYFIRVYAMSSSGLYAFQHLVVNVTNGVGAVTSAMPSVASVSTDITSFGDWRGAGSLTFVVSASSDGISYSPLGTDTIVTASGQGNPNLTVTTPFQFNWTPVTPITSIRITCRTRENYLYAVGRLGFNETNTFTFSMYTSEGISPIQISVTPTNVTKTTDGVNGSVVVTPTNGKFSLFCARRGDVFEDNAEETTFWFDSQLLVSTPSAPSNLNYAVGFSEYYRETSPQQFTCVSGECSVPITSTSTSTTGEEIPSLSTSILPLFSLILSCLIYVF